MHIRGKKKIMPSLLYDPNTAIIVTACLKQSVRILGGKHQNLQFCIQAFETILTDNMPSVCNEKRLSSLLNRNLVRSVQSVKPTGIKQKRHLSIRIAAKDAKD